MLFTKEYLQKSLDSTEMAESYRQYPHERILNKNDKVPFDLVISNKFRYFDQKSSEVKSIMYNARKAIAEKCYSSEVNGVYPNQGKIDSCIRENEAEFKKLDYLRETHFANIIFRHKLDLDNCPTYNSDCHLKADETFVWNSAKLPYFFAENY